MGHSILLLCRYERKGPSSRIRHYHYLPILEQAGFHVTAAPLLDNEYLSRLYCGQPRGWRLLTASYLTRLRHILTASRYDLIWIEKEALPWLPALIERWLLAGRPYIVDFDDPWHLRYATHPNPLIRALLGRKLETIAASASAVIVGGQALGRWAKTASARRIVEIPPAVDLDRYPVVPPPNGPFTVGWIGTPTTEKYLALIAEPLRRLHATCGARLRLIGGSGRLALPGVPIDGVEWSEETEGVELSRCHVGVMPMSDGEWERGKCGYKLIQYMAAGRPVVSSAVGPGLSIVQNGRTGYLANCEQDWVAHLGELAGNPQRAQAMGRAGRQYAAETYSLWVTAPPLVKAFADAIGSVPGRVEQHAPVSDWVIQGHRD